MVTSKKTSTTKRQPQNATDKHEIPGSIERELWIEESAYFLAESRGFISGFERDDWETATKHYASTIPETPPGAGSQKKS